MKFTKSLLYLITILLVTFFVSIFSYTQKTSAFDFNQNYLISDGIFINKDDMSEDEIQSFLEQKGSFLKDYHEGGRSAASIIYDAAHGHGEASGPPPNGCWYGICINTSTGTVNPKVLLVTLQKEQSLITKTEYSQYALDWAMGYGCFESGNWNEKYKGFTNQVEWGAWQLRYNYERAQGHGYSDYQVGQTMTFHDWNGSHSVHLDNRATSSLYRYTPHVYNGNYNFANLYDQWFETPTYHGTIVYHKPHPSLWPGEAYKFEVRIRNTGTATWKRGQVNLGTDQARDRISGFLREGGNPSGWSSGNRIRMVESSVAPGEIGTFRFWMKVPSWFKPGTYREYFALVREGVAWFNYLDLYWNVRVKSETEKYTSRVTYQNSAYPKIKRGQSKKFTLKVKNTGQKTWYRGRVNLGTDRPRDRITGFIREDRTHHKASGWLYYNRIKMKESSVAPGKTATFEFYMTAPSGMSPGVYKEYFRVVADGVKWLEDYGIYWEIRVE